MKGGLKDGIESLSKFIELRLVRGVKCDEEITKE